jgi:hypothetical protein
MSTGELHELVTHPTGKLEDGTEIRMSMFMQFDTRRSARKFEGWLVTRFPGPRNAAEIKQYGGRVAPTEYDFALFSSMLPHVYQLGG